MDDISAVADALEEYAAQTKRWVVLKLHSSLAMEDQVGAAVGHCLHNHVN
jgi:hypothetical protein